MYMGYTGIHHGDQAGFNLMILLPQSPIARTINMFHHAWLKPLLQAASQH